MVSANENDRSNEIAFDCVLESDHHSRSGRHLTIEIESESAIHDDNDLPTSHLSYVNRSAKRTPKPSTETEREHQVDPMREAAGESRTSGDKRSEYNGREGESESEGGTT